ncbi:MAG TPA: hypothetical protein VJR89_10135, partial [Polyangiales bacterium]|nr:hypothetical protein [Polyangiales bacterium]
TWTGVWLLEVQRAQQSSVRAEVLKATEGGGSPSQLAQALMASGKPRVLAHLAGPMELSKQQALDWIEQLGPRLAKMELPNHFARSSEQIFALAYASERRPPARHSPAQILDYLLDSFGGSLVCCARSSARSTWAVRLVRSAALLALILLAIHGVQITRPTTPPLVKPTQAAPAPKPTVTQPKATFRPENEPAKPASAIDPAEPATTPAAPAPEAAATAPAAPKRDKSRPNAKKDQSAAATTKPKAVASAPQSTSTAQPAAAQKSSDAKTNGK